MIDGERVVAIVPARGGSVRLRRKNLLQLGSRPLVQWPIVVARQTPGVDRVIVSTEDPEIAATAHACGAEVYDRPRSLATDTATVRDVIVELRKRLREESETARIVVVLEPTSPFRSPRLLERCVHKLTRDGYDSAATFHQCRTHPHQAWVVNDAEASTFIDGANPWVRSQELPPAYELSGEVYALDYGLVQASNPSLLVGRFAAVLVDSTQSVDVDSAADLELARSLFPGSELADLDRPAADVLSPDSVE